MWRKAQSAVYLARLHHRALEMLLLAKSLLISVDFGGILASGKCFSALFNIRAKCLNEMKIPPTLDSAIVAGRFPYFSILYENAPSHETVFSKGVERLCAKLSFLDNLVSIGVFGRSVVVL